MLWDRLFDTFVEEDEKCVYGTRAPLESWDPLWANLEVYADLARRSWQAGRWRDRLAVWFMPPGWQPATAGGPGWHKPHFDLSRVRRFDPPVGSAARAFAVVNFVAVLLGSTALLWYAEELPPGALAAASLAIIAVLWLIGAVMQGRLSPPVALAVELTAVLLLSAAVAARAALVEAGDGTWLRGQRVFTKTYPTNSGDEPGGLERAAWQRLGRNAMSADASTDLMLAVVTGAIEPQATSYMRSLLRRPADSTHSALGFGLPAGSLHENKVGTAFDTLEDVMYAELPSGRRLVIAAYTNGWNPERPPPADVAVLGPFTKRLVALLDAKVPLP
jgi:hypothetical protein